MPSPIYPDVLDGSHATAEAVQYFTGFFSAKSKHDAEETQSYFHPDTVKYYDATLGWGFTSHEELKAAWGQYMAQWPETAVSYPIRLIGDTSSAAVVMTNTPELFGGEIRAIAIVDLSDGRVIRWVDYWDGRGFGAAAAGSVRVPAEQFPNDLGFDMIANRTVSAVQSVAEQLTKALSNPDDAILEELLSYDVTLEDLALRTALRGRAAVGRYLQRGTGRLPYSGATVRHAVGNHQGGGYEWVSDGRAVPRGATALTLDDTGKISSLLMAWDGSLLDDAELTALTSLAVEPKR